jgi:hypothetical protein
MSILLYNSEIKNGYKLKKMKEKAMFTAYKQRVGGSNPSTPTSKTRTYSKM